MFIAIYSLLGRSPRGNAAVSPWPFVGGGALVLVGALAAWITLVQRATRRFNAENVEALRALGRGERERAVKLFDALVTRYRWPRSVQIVARYNLAWGLLQRGELARAAEVFASV